MDKDCDTKDHHCCDHEAEGPAIDDACCPHAGENVSELQKLQEELADYKNKYFLVLAELENTRKRLQKEKHDMMKFASQNVLSDFLAPIENMEKVMSFSDHMSQETKNWVYGFQMLVEKMKEVLSQHGVVAFNSLGSAFDLHFHVHQPVN